MTAKEKYDRDMCLLQTIFKQIDNGESPSFEALRGVMGASYLLRVPLQTIF